VAVAAVQLTPARIWWSAVRPVTLVASVAPVIAGTAVAIDEGGVQWWAGLGALVVAVAMQLGVNFANDYSDHMRGADKQRVGPVRASSSGVVKPEHVRVAAGAAFGVAALGGLVLSFAIDWRLIFVGAASILAGWLYTGGPRPYGYLGLGEVFVFVFFGLVATVGTVYVETSQITPLAVLVGAGMGFLASAILVLNNLRDIKTDAAAGKRTLATLIGRKWTRILLLALVVAAFAVPVAAWAFQMADETVLVVLLAIPIASVPVYRAFTSTTAPMLVTALRRMAMTELVYALLLSLGLLLANPR
jgi:1,4-dihydroxy-2-naphthoate octaprenyltransferase